MKLDFPSCASCTMRSKGMFCACTEEQLLVLDENKTGNLYRKGQIIFNEENRAHGIYCVLDGKIKLTKQGSEGREQIIRLAAGGDVLGFRAALTQQRFSASAVAMADSKVCFVPLATFRSIIDENTGVATEMMKMLSRAMAEVEEHLVNLALKPVRERVADALLLLDRVYNDHDESPFTIAMSREDLASLVGTAKETVIRFLGELKDEGIISSKGSSITILEKKRLMAISHLYD